MYTDILWLGRFYWVYIVFAITLEAYVSFPVEFYLLVDSNPVE